MRYVKIDVGTVLKGKGVAGMVAATSIGRLGQVDRSGRVTKVMPAGFEPPRRRDKIEEAVMRERIAASRRAYFARKLKQRPFESLKNFKV